MVTANTLKIIVKRLRHYESGEAAFHNFLAIKIYPKMPNEPPKKKYAFFNNSIWKRALIIDLPESSCGKARH